MPGYLPGVASAAHCIKARKGWKRDDPSGKRIWVQNPSHSATWWPDDAVNDGAVQPRSEPVDGSGMVCALG